VNELDEWLTKACTTLDIPLIDRGPVLDMARDVAHGVLRPAAPLTAYLLGVAVGRGADPQVAFARIDSLVKEWSITHTPQA
jgi:Domain of unknown function (DUF6457)